MQKIAYLIFIRIFLSVHVSTEDQKSFFRTDDILPGLQMYMSNTIDLKA